MSPRTHQSRIVAKLTAQAQEQATRDNEPMAVVKIGDSYVVKPLRKALSICTKHDDAMNVQTCWPKS